MANKTKAKEKETKNEKEKKVENIKKEKITCPNCSKKYLATLDECPYCGYTDKLPEEKKVVEDEDDEEEELDEEYDDDDEVVEQASKKNEKVEEDVVVNENNELKTIKTLSIISICISVLTLLLTFVILSGVNELKDNLISTSTNDEEETEYDVSMFTEITASEFIDMFDEDDDTIYFVYTGRSSCSYCVAFLPYLQESVEEYDYTLYYLDITTVTSDEQETILELDEELEEDYGSTPMVFAIQNGEVIDVNYGYTDYDTYASFLEDNEVEEK